MFRSLCILSVSLLAASGAAADAGNAADAAQSPRDGWIELFNGKDLSGWKFRNPTAKNLWVVCRAVRLDPKDPARFLPEGEGGGPDAVLLNGEDGRSSDLMTERNFWNYDLHLEFTVPKGSNSGVYNRGLYEIQILDSYGVKQPAFHDCGSLYERWKPSVNMAKPPGAWQTYDIRMRGKKLSLVWNGRQMLKDYDVRYGETDKAAFERLRNESLKRPPELRVKLEEKDGRYVGFFGEGGTRASLEGPDRPGPILLQGDHGPVAFRHIRIRPLTGESGE